jgi:hypothetical protein
MYEKFPRFFVRIVDFQQQQQNRRYQPSRVNRPSTFVGMYEKFPRFFVRIVDFQQQQQNRRYQPSWKKDKPEAFSPYVDNFSANHLRQRVSQILIYIIASIM